MIVLKIWSGILFISGSLILLSSCLYLLTENSKKISREVKPEAIERKIINQSKKQNE